MGVFLAWILARLDRDRQRGARRAWLAAARSINIVHVFGGLIARLGRVGRLKIRRLLHGLGRGVVAASLGLPEWGVQSLLLVVHRWRQKAG
jgi:hypothetical protein